MFKELEVVRLKVDVPDHGLAAGEEGTVVMAHSDPEAYEVEFLEAGGTTRALVGLKPGQIELVSK